MPHLQPFWTGPSAFLAIDSRSKLTSTVEKWERWHPHFEEVCNVSRKVLERVLDTFPEVRPQRAGGDNGDESLCCEAREDEIRAAIKPGVDMITAELLKLGEETVVQ